MTETSVCKQLAQSRFMNVEQWVAKIAVDQMC